MYMRVYACVGGSYCLMWEYGSRCRWRSRSFRSAPPPALPSSLFKDFCTLFVELTRNDYTRNSFSRLSTGFSESLNEGGVRRARPNDRYLTRLPEHIFVYGICSGWATLTSKTLRRQATNCSLLRLAKTKKTVSRDVQDNATVYYGGTGKL